MTRTPEKQRAEELPLSSESRISPANPETREQSSQPVVSVGIDWTDSAHAYALRAPDGTTHAGEFKQTPEAIGTLLESWTRLYPDARIEICIETSRGALINALLESPHVTIYPVNPNALANYRKSFAHGGGKSDPVDAQLILQYLESYPERLRPLRRDEPQTRELATLCEDRRRLVDQRVALANELKALLKVYFPAILLLEPARIHAEFIVRLLLKFPSLEQVQAAGRTKLRKLLFGIGAKAIAEKRLDVLMNATPLTSDAVAIRSCARRVQAICGLLDSLNRSISSYDSEIKKLVKTHADYVVVASLPGASHKTQGRIIAALGDDRSRYANAAAFQAAAGIAPLTSQSGKQRYVSSRWACTKFIKQTFHEYAGLSITKCAWAKAYYDLQLSKGKSTHMARRALAYKWMRVTYRLWQEREAYDDVRYVERLKATGSPIAERLSPAA
ncbi:IS110 family RNA-guided transposase [Candidatus Laterigemmans baculatus]|uniref:IS110 family transposase n=1 Tax=Candidatus Laterigemmans baculatus TaxID=2770505 RepID=UPI001F344E18|nr:IS110 family transposase [Candidatus Laterigemmans baculatus]